MHNFQSFLFFSDFAKLVAYIAFFVILMHLYGLPLYILRDLFTTFRSFVKRINDMIQYRRATHNMDER